MHHLCRKFSNTDIEYDDLFGLCELAFMKAYKTFNATTKWATYYVRIATNEILMQIRKRKKIKDETSLQAILNTDIDGNEQTLESILPSGINIEQDYLDREELERLRTAIEQLTGKHKEVIELKLRGIKQNDIGVKLGISQSYVSRLEKAAMAKLKKLLREENDLGKKKHKQAFNPPTRYPQGMMAVAQQIQKKHDEDIIKETNNTVNLVTSAYSIVLHEFYDMPKEQLKEALVKVYEQLDLCAKEIVTIDQMMDLCSEYGLEVTQTADKLDEFGTLMMHKIKAFELLDQGVTEVEDIAKKGHMTSRLASAFRWQWNKIRFGKDYEGDVIEMSNKELCNQLFDKGATVKQAVEKTGLMESSVKTYFNTWKRDVLADLTTEEAAPYFAGDKELWQLKKEKSEGVIENEAVEEVSEVQEQPKTEAVTTAEVEPDVKVEEPKVEVVAEPVKPTRAKGLRKKVVIEGEFAEYKPSAENLVSMEAYGQVLDMTRDEMLALAEEFRQIAEDPDMWKGVC